MVCKQCGAAGLPGHPRCAVCGSTSLALQLAPLGRSKGRKFLSAWERRPKGGVLDVDAPALSKNEATIYLAIGQVKLLVETYLAAILIFGRIGPFGLQYASYVARYPLGIALFVGAFLSGVGGYG